MPDTTVYNAKSDTVTSILAAVHPARPSTASDSAVTNAWATHDFYATPGNIINIPNAYGTKIPHSPKSYQTGAIASPTTVIREKYYPTTADEKTILDAYVARGDLFYAAKPAAPA